MFYYNATFKKNNSLFAVVFIDLDLFKNINDTIGLTKGNQLLIAVAERLKTITGKDKFLFRNGGDEFLYIVNRLSDIQKLNNLTDRIINIFKESFTIDDQHICITCSIGVSIFPEHGTTSEDLIKLADIAMYEAKRRGRNNAVIFNFTMMSGLVQELNLTNELYKALENNEFELYYQPQVDSIENKVVGLEALIRWTNPKIGIVSPSVFIPIAEERGLILEIGEWVINTAINQEKYWIDNDIIDVPISINISVNQFVNNNLAKYINNRLIKAKLKPSSIKIEVTENIVLDKYKNSISILNELNNLGIKIAIDDFGMMHCKMKCDS